MTDRERLTPAVWDLAVSCFDGALALPVDERAAYAEGMLGADPIALRETLDMLAFAVADRALAIEPRLLASDHDEDLLVAGTRLGAYRLVDLIGRGGMGEVYRAERIEGGYEQPAAIKVLRAGLSSRELVRRFESERRILARLAHPHIVTILDGGSTADGRPYLVMPYVDGLPVVEYADANRLSLEHRLRLFIEVVDAVQYAHARLVVHRDIKPSNILVTAAGQVQLLDFGIAKLLAPAEPTGGAQTPVETRSMLRILTPEHAAPEQVRGDTVSVATDIYALGVLLYQSLTGTRPHVLVGRSRVELEREILEREPLPPSTAGWKQPWKRRLRGDLDRIVMMALRKEPDRRYASAGQFGDDIDRFLRGLPVRAESDSLSYRARKFMHRNRFAVAAAASVAALLLAFAANTARQARQLERERDVAQREQASTEAVVGLLTSFFRQANPMDVPGGDTLRVHQLLDFAEARVDSLRGEPQVQARMWSVLGTMHLARGRPDLARTLLQRAYDRFLVATGSDSLEVARTYRELARAVDSYEGRRSSLPMFEQSLERFRRVLPDTASELLAAQLDLAARLDDAAQQRTMLERLTSTASLSATVDTMERAERMHALAIERLNAGAISEATVLFEEVLRLVDAKLPANHPNRLIVAGTVAAARRQSGQFDVALTMTQELLAEVQARQPRNPLGVAASMEALAAVQAELGFLEQAEATERAALAGWRSSLVPTHPSVWYALQNMAMITAQRGRGRDALAYIDSSLSLARAGQAGEADLLQLLDLRGEILLRVDRVRDASLATTALTRRITVTWPASHLVRTTHAWRLGALDLAEGRPDGALRHFDASIGNMMSLVPATYPQLMAAQCGRSIALMQLGRGAEARPALADVCERYRRYGLHLPQMLSWSRQAKRLQAP